MINQKINMEKISGLISPKIGKNNLIQTAYTHLHLKKCLDNFLEKHLNFSDQEKKVTKFFIDETATTVNVKIKTSKPMHGIVLKTEQMNLISEIETLLKKLNKKQSLRLIIL